MTQRMPTQKRRVVYLLDDDWERAKAEAAQEGKSVSEHIRLALRLGRNLPGRGVLLLPPNDPPMQFRPVPKPKR